MSIKYEINILPCRNLLCVIQTENSLEFNEVLQSEKKEMSQISHIVFRIY